MGYTHSINLLGGLVAKFTLKAYARQGAASRAAELNAELTAIYRAFPDLPQGPTVNQVSRIRTRSRMSAAQKAEVSRRMKAYWAARRKAKRAAQK